MTNDENITDMERALGAKPRPAPAAWARLRRDLSSAAERSGLIDVAFERHDSPLGTILVGATRDGLVRVGLPAEDEDTVLQQLAERVSPRVLHASRDSLTQTRRELDEYFGRTRQQFEVTLDWRLTSGFRREVLRATARDPLRPHGLVRRRRRPRRQPEGGARRRLGARHQPAADRRALPPRAAHRRRPGRLRAAAWRPRRRCSGSRAACSRQS